MLFFQLPWLPECILRRRDWALLVRVLQNTSPPGVFSDSDLEQYKESWARKDALTAMLTIASVEARVRFRGFARESAGAPHLG